MKKLKPLRINGYKNIISGKLLVKEELPLFDTKINLYAYRYNDKIYYVLGTDLQVIGYTDDKERIRELTSKAHIVTYKTFWLMCGRN
jgi:hypothetical protein